MMYTGDMATGALVLMWVCIEPIPEQFFREALSCMLAREVSDLELFSLRGSLGGLLHLNRKNTEWKLNHRSTLLYTLGKYSIINDRSIHAAKRAMLQTLRQYMYPHPFILETLLRFGISEGDTEVLASYARCFSDSSDARECLSRIFCDTLNFGYFARGAELLKDDSNAFVFLCFAFFSDSPREAVIMDDLLDEDADEVQRKYGTMDYEDCLSHVIGIAGEILDEEAFSIVYQWYCQALHSSYVFAEGSSEKKRLILQALVQASLTEADHNESEEGGFSSYGYILLSEAAYAQLLICFEAENAKEQAADFECARSILIRLGNDGARYLLNESQGNFLSALSHYNYLLMHSTGDVSKTELQRLDSYIKLLEARENPEEAAAVTLFSLYFTLIQVKETVEDSQAKTDGDFPVSDKEMIELLEKIVGLGQILYPHKMLDTSFIYQYTSALQSLGLHLFLADRLDEAEHTFRSYYDMMVNLSNNGLLSREDIANSELFSASLIFTEIYLKKIGNLRYQFADLFSETADGRPEKYLADIVSLLKEMPRAAAEDESPGEHRRATLPEAIGQFSLVFTQLVNSNWLTEAGDLMMPLKQLSLIYVSAIPNATVDSFDPYYRHHAHATVRQRYDFVLSTLNTMMELLRPEHASLKNALSNIIYAVKRDLGTD